MSAKVAIPVIIGLAIGGLALILGARKAGAAPPEVPEVEIPPTEVAFPKVDNIMAAKSIAELDTFYRLIGEQFITGQISYVEYMALYRAYETRFYELTGVTE